MTILQLKIWIGLLLPSHIEQLIANEGIVASSPI